MKAKSAREIKKEAVNAIVAKNADKKVSIGNLLKWLDHQKKEMDQVF